jgi:hypothetical protein
MGIWIWLAVLTAIMSLLADSFAVGLGCGVILWGIGMGIRSLIKA